MARHSKWHQIRLKKGIADAKRGKVFTRHARLIAVTAQRGGDPERNPALRAAIDNAKADNLPNDNIERAIKKGTGEDKETVQFHEVVYEGYAPGGIALVVEALTDNKNRTSQQVRTTFEKYGGNFGAPGSVAYLFERKGLIRMMENGAAELVAIDAGATDTDTIDGHLLVYTAPNDLHAVRQKLIDHGFELQSAELVYEPVAEVAVHDPADLKKAGHLIEALDDLDDVLNVWTNGELPEN